MVNQGLVIRNWKAALTLAALAFCCVLPPHRACATSVDRAPGRFVLPEDVDVQFLKGVFDALGAKCDIDKDGDLRLEGQYTFFIRVHRDKSILSILSFWKLSKGASIAEKVAQVNDWNRSIVMAKFALVDQETLVTDYDLDYTGGIRIQQIVDSFERTRKAVLDAIGRLDKHNIVGTDKGEEGVRPSPGSATVEG